MREVAVVTHNESVGVCPEREFRDWALANRVPLRSFAFLLSNDWHAADDLVQETLIRMYARWATIRASGPPDRYARKTLANLYVDRTRRSWFRRELSVPEVRDGEAYWDSVDHDGPAERAIAALRLLAPRQRTAIALRYWENHTLDEVAQAMGCSVGTAKSQISRGLSRLRASLSTPSDDAPSSQVKEKQ